MATEKRLIDANEMKNNIMEAMMRQFEKNGDQIALRIAEMMCHFIDVTDTVDAVPVADIRLHRILIDNEGVPEVKLQIGDRYFILRTDLVDVRKVVHGKWIPTVYSDPEGKYYLFHCSECCTPNAQQRKYCPNCGADMRGDGNV